MLPRALYVHIAAVSVSMETPLMELIPEPAEMGSAQVITVGWCCAARGLCCPLKYKQSLGAWHVLTCLFSVLLADVFPEVKLLQER